MCERCTAPQAAPPKPRPPLDLSTPKNRPYLSTHLSLCENENVFSHGTTLRQKRNTRQDPLARCGAADHANKHQSCGNLTVTPLVNENAYNTGDIQGAAEAAHHHPSRQNTDFYGTDCLTKAGCVVAEEDEPAAKPSALQQSPDRSSLPLPPGSG